MINYNKKISNIVLEVAEVAGYLWQRGWAERNGGNISYNITDEIDQSLADQQPLSDKIALSRRMEHLGGNFFLVTGTNRRMRYVHVHPMQNMSIIRIADNGESYQIIAERLIWPTSELPAHLTMHNYLKGQGRNNKVVLHTHPTELIAMTHNPAFLHKDVMTNLLWSMIPETRAFCPKGVGIVPYSMPGSQELADQTVKLLDEYDVVMWEKHGALAIGENAIECFDMIDTLSKSAQIYTISKSMGFEPTGMSSVQMDAMKEAFNL